MTTTGNRVTPTTTCTPARIRLFQPTQRPVHRKGDWLISSWGRCRVTGRIGQRHADLLESILFVAEKRRETADGAIELLVDPARIRRCMSAEGYSGDGLRSLIVELEQVVVEVETPEFKLSGHLVDHVISTTKTMRRDPLTGENRPLLTVRLGLPLVHLIKNDLPLYYDPSPISKLRFGVSQAVARHVLTHKAGQEKTVDGVLAAVCGEMSPTEMRNRRRELRQNAAGLAALGIAIDGETIRRD